jgi:cystathionine beta-lyase/cystathionine gamma-synthase
MPTPDPENLRPDSVAIRAGRADNGTALAPVLWGSSVFATPSLAEARRMSTVPRAERFYSRYSNPSVKAFEDAVAALEGAESSLAFASGMGALASVVLALCSPGDHIVAQRQIYSGTQLFLAGVCSRFGIEHTLVDATVPGALADAVRPGRTMLVIAETPANPQLTVTDLAELGAIQGPFTLVDGTFAPPVVQQPLSFGVDLVMHSATKGISGHNDATLGVVSGAADLLEAIWAYSVLHGACASPFDATNGLRGIRTLPVRIARQSDTAQRLAEHLEGHPAVSRVMYPGLTSHPQHDVAKRQMTMGGSMIAVELAGGLEAGRGFVEGVRLAQMASSLGGPETLVCSPANSTHAGLTPDELAAADIGPGLVRISVGLEHVDDLIADIDAALSGAERP